MMPKKDAGPQIKFGVAMLPPRLKRDHMSPRSQFPFVDGGKDHSPHRHPRGHLTRHPRGLLSGGLFPSISN